MDNMYGLIRLIRRYYKSGDLTKEQVMQLVIDLYKKKTFIKRILLYYNWDGLLIDHATNLIIARSKVKGNDIKNLHYFNAGDFIDIYVNDNKFYTITFMKGGTYNG